MVGKLGVKLVSEAAKRRFSQSSDNTPDVETGTKSLADPLIKDGNAEVRQRKEMPRYVPSDWDDDLPYGGKVYLARRKKPESFHCLVFQGSVVVFAVAMMYCGWFYTEIIHFHVTKLYAKMGHKDAQALIGHKLLHGVGRERDQKEAMLWLHEAAKQGHPHASYNVAVGHLQGMKTALKPGEAHKFIRHAAENGVAEAEDVLIKVCSRGQCDI